MLIKESMMYVCTYSKRKYIRHRNRHHKCAQFSAAVIFNLWHVMLQNKDSDNSRSGVGTFTFPILTPRKHFIKKNCV